MSDNHLVENIAYQCVTKHIHMGMGDQTAIRWLAASHEQQEISYLELEILSNQIANLLRSFGIGAGDCVSVFLPRTPELITSFLGILKVQAISCVLFSTFGENALLDRLLDNSARAIITKKSLLRRIQNIQYLLPKLEKILVIDLDEHIDNHVLSLPVLLNGTPDTFEYPARLSPDTPAFLQYTSGSTGKPKGVIHVHGGTSAMLDSMTEVMDIQEGELYWCTADPAWITGLVYGVIAPLTLGVDQIQYGGAFHAVQWLGILQDYSVNVWYTAPTALRMLMQEDEQVLRAYDYSQLRKIFSVGEPLNAEIYHWGKRIFTQEINDTFFQSETGTIMIANRPGIPIRPGSMGKPLSYINAYILDESGQPVPAKQQGHLCFQAGWNSMFRGYLNKAEAYGEKFRNGYYFTGDLAWQDGDGYFWYVGRADDVINTAGHLVGPFEVESALLEIDEIMDVAVIGVPDPILHEKIIAFICLPNGQEWDRGLELKCRVNISNRVSTVAIPQEFHVVEKIPKNKSGKILRRVLKAWYQGKDPGDLSTMED